MTGYYGSISENGNEPPEYIKGRISGSVAIKG
jgi:hypothetical protein